MATIKEDVYPQQYNVTTHKLTRTSVFVTTDTAPLAPQEFFSSLVSNIILADQEVIVIEEAVGYRLSWNRVIYNNVTGYVIREYLVRAAREIKPSIPPNTSPEFNPPIHDVPAIDWTTIKVDEPIYDRKTAKYILRYDTGIDNVEGQDIKEIMKNALYKGAKLILREEGKRFDRVYVNNLIENYFLFGQAEKYYFEFRPCSTMHVLVTIPARYLQSEIIEANDVSVFYPNEDSENPEHPVDSDGIYDPDASLDPQISEVKLSPARALPVPSTIEYDDLSDLDNHFGVIEFLLAQNELIRVTNKWIIEPSNIDLNLTYEIGALNIFKNTLKNFIKKNKLAYSPSGLNYADIFTNEQFEKKGKLILYIDEKNRTLKSIKFLEAGTNKLIPLNRGAKNFYNSGFIKNETIINYILKIPKNKQVINFLLEETGKTALGALTTVGTVAGAIATTVGAPITGVGVVAGTIAVAGVQAGIQGSLADSFEAEFRKTQEITSGNNITDRKLTLGENIQEGLDYASAVTNGVVGAATAISDKILENIEGISEFLQELAPVTGYKKFIFAYHYPAPSTLESLPIDLVDCIVDNADRLRYLKETKLQEFKKAYAEFKIDYQKRNNFYKENSFGQILLQDANSIKDGLVLDPKIRKLFGMDPDFDENLDPVTAVGKKLNQTLALFDGLDWQRFLAEAIKCASFSFNPPDLQGLIKNYQKVRKLLENMAAMSVCNPYLTAALKQINSFQLPIFKVKNPNADLIDQLKQVVYQVINDTIVLLIRQLLTNSLKNCLTDKNPNFGNNNPNNLGDIIDDPTNDPELDNLLDDLFDTRNDDGTIDPDNREAAKEALKELLNDILPCLSALEICELLNGKIVNSEVYQFIINLIKKKGYSYNSGNNVTTISDLLNTESAIRDLFNALGSVSSLTNCQDIIDAANPKDRINPLCNGEQIECLRKGILDGKGLPRDKIDELLNDIRDQETKNLDDVLKFLEDPEQFTNKDLPITLCRDGVPPIVSLGPSADSFRDLNNNLFADVYTQFNDEAREWYKTTYSLINSAGNDFLKFENGKIIGKSQDDLSESNSSKSDITTRLQIASGSQEKIPAYLFNNIFKDDGTFKIYEEGKGYTHSNEIITLNSFLDGYEQQKLDITIINNQIRAQVIVADNAVKEFLGKFMACLTAYGTNAFLKTVTNSRPSSVSSNDVIDSVLNTINNISKEPFVKFLQLVDLFLRNNTVDLSNNTFSLLEPDSKQVANAFYFADSSFPASLKIIEYFENNAVFNRNDIFSKISTIDLSGLTSLVNNLGVNLDFSTSYRPSETFTNYFGNDLSSNNNINLDNLYNAAVTSLIPIKNSYQAIKKAIISYPSYTITGSFNLKELPLSQNKIIKNTDLGTLNDLYILDIKKNNNNYLTIKNGERIKDEIYDYITGTLGIKENINKQLVFEKILEKYNDTPLPKEVNIDIFNITSYDYTSRIVLENIRKNIFSNNLFLLNEDIQEVKYKTGAKVKSTDDQEIDEEKTVEIKEPFTRYYSSAIVGKPQTALDKQCGLNKHYLDIDDIKNTIINENNKRICKTAETIDEKLQNSLQISSNDLTDIQTNEEQNIIQTGFYKLAIRTFAHDIMLRGISIFGRYDPQSLRNDSLFLEFMSNLIESEMRGLDNTFYEMLTRHFIKEYSFKNKATVPTEQYKLFKRIIFKNIVKEELQNYVLIKFAKRLDIDANDYLPTNKELKIINIFDDVQKMESLIKYIGSSVYIQTNDGYKKIYEGKTSNVKREFTGSIEFKTLFEYVFPLTKYLSFYFINHVMATSTRRQIIDAFKNTKKVITGTTKLVVSNGEPIVADTDNLQDAVNLDGAEFFKKFIFEALIQTPIKIFKAFVEGSEPNIALSSTIYKTAKFFIPETPSFIIPGISLPLGLIPTPLTCLIPFTNPILSLIYFATLLWYEDGTQETNEDTADQWFDIENVDCSSHIMSNKEIIEVNNFGYYEIKRGLIPYNSPQQAQIDESTQAPGETSALPRTP